MFSIKFYDIVSILDHLNMHLTLSFTFVSPSLSTSDSDSDLDSSETSFFALFLGGPVFFAGVLCLFTGADFLEAVFPLPDFDLGDWNKMCVD